MQTDPSAQWRRSIVCSNPSRLQCRPGQHSLHMYTGRPEGTTAFLRDPSIVHEANCHAFIQVSASFSKLCPNFWNVMGVRSARHL
jgi:hypothetical protein